MTQKSFAVETTSGPIAAWESGDGLPVLFLHGGPGVNDYGRLITAEAGDWRFISFQQRGLGPSTTSGPFTMEQHAADAVAVLDALDIGPAVVAGHSFGGYLALHLALSYPDRVAGLLLIDGLGVIGDGGLGELDAEMTARLQPGARERLQQLEKQIEDAPSDDLHNEAIRLLWPSYFADRGSVAEFDLRVSEAAYTGAWESVGAHQSSGFADRLGEIAMPVISVLGERSPLPVSQGQQTAALIPAAEVRIVPGAGHLPWHERPGCVAEALRDLWSRAGEADAVTI